LDLLLVSFQDILMLLWNVVVDVIGRGYLEVIGRWQSTERFAECGEPVFKGPWLGVVLAVATSAPPKTNATDLGDAMKVSRLLE
jgi:hypothetical protein